MKVVNKRSALVFNSGLAGFQAALQWLGSGGGVFRPSPVYLENRWAMGEAEFESSPTRGN